MNKKPLPDFKDETEERRFWAEADSADYLDWSAAQSVSLPDLHPTLKTRLARERVPQPAASD